jgi:hypothetical protein
MGNRTRDLPGHYKGGRRVGGRGGADREKAETYICGKHLKSLTEEAVLENEV